VQSGINIGNLLPNITTSHTRRQYILLSATTEILMPNDALSCTTSQFRCETHLSFHASNEHSSSWHIQLRTPGTTDSVFHYIFKRNFPLVSQRGHLIFRVFHFHECKLTSSLDSHYSQVDIQCSRMQNWEKTHSDIHSYPVLTQSTARHTYRDMFIYLSHAKLWIKLWSGCYITISVNICKG